MNTLSEPLLPEPDTLNKAAPPATVTNILYTGEAASRSLLCMLKCLPLLVCSRADVATLPATVQSEWGLYPHVCSGYTCEFYLTVPELVCPSRSRRFPV